MTTSAQQTVLSVDELSCLRAIAIGKGDVRDVQVQSLVAKGMVVSAAEPMTLTPAIPEPETYALYLAGLCAAWLARRRRSAR